MAKEDRLNWFPCEPTRLLGALARMKPPKKIVYMIVLLRIYENGGACPDTIEALAMQSGFNKRIVTDVLSELCKENRLYFGEDGIRNWKADEVIADSIALRERRKSAGSNGGKRTAEKLQQKQRTVSSKAAANEQPSPTPIQLQEQDSLFSIENRVPASASKPVRAKVDKPKPEPVVEADDGWPADHLEQFWHAFPPYRREGMRKVGEKLAKIRASKVISWDALISAVKRFAATNPGEYAPAPLVWLNGERWDRVYGNQNGGNRHGETRVQPEPKLGFAGIAARIRQARAERADDAAAGPIDAGDLEPGDGHRFASPALGRLDRAGEAAPFAGAPFRR